jgi:hypothetical protein
MNGDWQEMSKNTTNFWADDTKNSKTKAKSGFADIMPTFR